VRRLHAKTATVANFLNSRRSGFDGGALAAEWGTGEEDVSQSSRHTLVSNIRPRSAG
jgi:hypothetical protein